MTALRTALRRSLDYPSLARHVSLAATVVEASADVLELADSHETIRKAMSQLTDDMKCLNQRFTELNNALRTGDE